MRKEDCIFCKIAAGEIPSYTVYEDEVVRAILDAAPANEGHTLVLPKEHYDDLFSLPEDTAAHVIRVAKEIAARQKKALHCDGVNLLQNNGEAAGQSVMHFHMHVIPRFALDGHLTPWKGLQRSDEEQEATLGRIK